MRIHRIKLVNFRGVESAEVTFDIQGTTVIEGDNEVGKSSVVEGFGLLLDKRFPDRSGHRRVKSVKPVHRDAGTMVEAEISSGQYRFVFHKQWGRGRKTLLDILAPRREQLTGDEAHERVQLILDETLDRSLWEALSVQQGTKLSLPSFGVPDLGAALDAAAGDSYTDGRNEGLWESIVSERNEYWTATGRPRPNLSESRQGVEQARNNADSLKEKLDEVEADADLAARIAADETRLADACAEYESVREDCQSQMEAAQGLEAVVGSRKVELDRAEAERDRARTESRVRSDLIDDLASRAKDVQDLNARAEQSSPALAAARRHHDEALAARDAARTLHEATQEASTLADRDREHLRQIIEARQLGERRDRVVEAQAALDRSSAALEAIRLDDDDVSQIESAHLAVISAEAAARTGSALVTTTALSDIEVAIDGAPAALEIGDERVTPVSDSVEIVVPDSVKLVVAAAEDSRQLTRRLSDARAELRRRCAQVDVAGVEEARTVLERRNSAVREQDEASAAIERDLQDLTPDSLVSKAERLSARVAGYEAERVSTPPMPANYDDATRLALDLRESLAEHKSQHDQCMRALDSAARALHDQQVAHAVLSAQMTDAQARRDRTEETLNAARTEQPDADLTADLVSAEAAVRGARSAWEKARAEFDAADMDALKSRLENAQAAARRAEVELQSNRERLRGLRVSLDVRGESGLQTQHQAAISALDWCSRESEALERRAQAAKLLYDTFGRRRVEAQQRYVGPFKERIEQFGHIVYNESFEVEISDDLSVSRRTLDDVTLDVDQLSTGAQEQLGIIARLACAAIVSPDGGGAPVILDDALGWSDPSRLQRMGAAIAAAGRHCQVIVLTCTPGRYAHVGNATVVNLPS